MPKLEDELTAASCDIDPETFRTTIASLFAECYPNSTDEDLVHTPDEAKRYCNLIRLRVNAPQLTDFIILRTLSNMRKKSALNL